MRIISREYSIYSEGDSGSLPSVEAFYGPYESKDAAITAIKHPTTGYVAKIGAIPIGLKFGVKTTGSAFQEYRFVGYLAGASGVEVFEDANCVLVGSGNSSVSVPKAIVKDSTELDALFADFKQGDIIYVIDDITYTSPAVITIPKDSLIIAKVDRGSTSASNDIRDFAIIGGGASATGGVKAILDSTTDIDAMLLDYGKGDMFVVSTDITYGSGSDTKTYSAGDILIASADRGSAGNISDFIVTSTSTAGGVMAFKGTVNATDGFDTALAGAYEKGDSYYVIEDVTIGTTKVPAGSWIVCNVSKSDTSATNSIADFTINNFPELDYSSFKGNIATDAEMSAVIAADYVKGDMYFTTAAVKSDTTDIPKNSWIVCNKSKSDTGSTASIADFTISSVELDLADVATDGTSTTGVLAPSRKDDLTFKLESVVSEGKVYDGFEAMKTTEDGVYIIDKNGDAVLIADEDGLNFGDNTTTNTITDADFNAVKTDVERILAILGNFYDKDNAANDIRIEIS